MKNEVPFFRLNQLRFFPYQFAQANGTPTERVCQENRTVKNSNIEKWTIGAAKMRSPAFSASATICPFSILEFFTVRLF